WLFTILRNCYYSELRHRKFEIEDPDGICASQVAISPDHDAKLHLRDLSRALQHLPPDQREALILVCATGLSYEEAAGVCRVAAAVLPGRPCPASRRRFEPRTAAPAAGAGRGVDFGLRAGSVLRGSGGCLSGRGRYDQESYRARSRPTRRVVGRRCGAGHGYVARRQQPKRTREPDRSAHPLDRRAAA